MIPGVIFDPKHIFAGVPQGFILGPLLFLVYINDIVEEIQSNIDSLADDTCLSMVVGNPSRAGTILQNDINRIYTTQNLLRITFSFNDLMLKTNQLKQDFFVKIG